MHFYETCLAKGLKKGRPERAKVLFPSARITQVALSGKGGGGAVFSFSRNPTSLSFASSTFSEPSFLRNPCCLPQWRDGGGGRSINLLAHRLRSPGLHLATIAFAIGYAGYLGQKKTTGLCTRAGSRVFPTSVTGGPKCGNFMKSKGPFATTDGS